ncbi:MAG: GNVR domain-containing protein, partial [Bacteroidota bacterium]
DDPTTISKIAALDLQGVTSYVDTLKALSLKYNQLLIRYTPRYPRVQSVREEVVALLGKSAEALQAAIQNTQARRASVASLREQTLGDLSRSINVQAYGTERSAEFIRVKDNYDAAKQRLGQAKVTKELADRGASKYVILDPAQAPDRPTKPKKMLIMMGGAALGLIVGIAAMWLMEYYDPTVRRRQDIEVFNKPIIGYLP